MSKKILIAEDDEFIARAYKDGLTRADFKVEVSKDGEEALNKIKENKPDLLLLDLIMPEKDGFEVLETLKADDDLKDIPVLILSNLGQATDIERGKKLGAADYLIKSDHSMKEVIEKVKGLLGEYKDK